MVHDHARLLPTASRHARHACAEPQLLRMPAEHRQRCQRPPHGMPPLAAVARHLGAERWRVGLHERRHGPRAAGQRVRHQRLPCGLPQQEAQQRHQVARQRQHRLAGQVLVRALTVCDGARWRLLPHGRRHLHGQHAAQPQQQRVHEAARTRPGRGRLLGSRCRRASTLLATVQQRLRRHVPRHGQHRHLRMLVRRPGPAHSQRHTQQPQSQRAATRRAVHRRQQQRAQRRAGTQRGRACLRPARGAQGAQGRAQLLLGACACACRGVFRVRRGHLALVAKLQPPPRRIRHHGGQSAAQPGTGTGTSTSASASASAVVAASGRSRGYCLHAGAYVRCPQRRKR
mmetsp:Transcript_26557/g.85461  ORF Transcript_26557/g.85461 Transcript_26557/m.85461 type:complete len:343 (+) Transcript_26557:1333-2361(+)